MKRSPMRRRRPTPRRREAPREEFDWWTDATNALLRRSGGRCERRGCDLYRTGIERHHRIRRRDGGDRLANLLALCPDCHAHITRHPAEARENGWIVTAHAADPTTVPVLIAGTWWLLDDDGGRTRTTPPALPD